MAEIESASRRTGTFTGTRGHALHFVRVAPPANVVPLGLVVFLHGLGEYASRYDEFFTVLADHGWVVYAYDYAGHGLSEGDRMYFDRFDDVVADAESFVAFAKRDTNAPACVLVGNSLGGLVANFIVLRKTHSVDAVVLVAPGLDVPRTWVLQVQSAVAHVLSAVVPKWRIVPGGDRSSTASLDMGMECITVLLDLSTDQAVLNAIDTDPLLNTLPTSCRVGAELLCAFSTLAQQTQHVDLPVLVVLGSEERMVSTASIHRYVQDITSPDKELQEFDGMGHLMLLEGNRRLVFDSILVWLHRRFSKE